MNQQPSSSEPNQSINIQHSSNKGQIGQAGGDLAQIYGEVINITLPELRDVSGLLGTSPVSSPKPLTQQEYRQRQDLLKSVKQSWIEGVLEKSLHNRTLIALGLQEQRDTLQHPHKELEEFLEASGQSLPPGTGILDVFNRIGAERTLLILGEPGSGKTTMLLKLAQSMVVLGLIFGTSNWLVGVFFGGLAPRFGNWLHFGLSNGLLLAILSGLIPGAACVQHLILRLILWQNGAMPWNYARFLNYATNRIFLQKVGGGYIFIHRLLLEHFAQRRV